MRFLFGFHDTAPASLSAELIGDAEAIQMARQATPINTPCWYWIVDALALLFFVDRASHSQILRDQALLLDAESVLVQLLTDPGYQEATGDSYSR